MADAPRDGERTRRARAKPAPPPAYPAPASTRPREFSNTELADRTRYRRAVEAAIWGMPIVAFDAMREAFVRDAGARFNDVCYLSTPADWKLQFTTPNASSLYMFVNFNTKDGPIVYEVPAATGAGLFGSMSDAWQAPLVDVGPAGDDEGKGGKYLLLPPGYTEPEPAGYFTVRMNTYNGYSILRATPASPSDADVANALDLVKQIKLYPLSEAAHPRAQRYIDISGTVVDGIPQFDASFYERLARMVSEETVQPRDLVAMGQLHSLGIAKGAEFAPDAHMHELFTMAIAEAHARFVQNALAIHGYWPDSHWGLPSIGSATATAFTFETGDRLDIDGRGTTFFLDCGPPKKLGAASFYLWATHDSSDEAFQGGDRYRLRVPPKVPVKQFWAVTVYDLETAGFIRESPRVELSSYDEHMKTNDDGSVDVYFGPNAPAEKESNWIFTAEGRPWFAAFRFYGPEKAVADKSWVLPDIEAIR